MSFSIISNKQRDSEFQDVTYMAHTFLRTVFSSKLIRSLLETDTYTFTSEIEFLPFEFRENI
jgi:hypothetical protein